MKIIQTLPTAFLVSGSIGVLMAFILTNNQSIPTQMVNVIPAQKPVSQSVRLASTTNELPTQSIVVELPNDIDQIITGSISSKSNKKFSHNIGDTLKKNSNTATLQPSTDKSITVQSGDTLYGIAHRTGVNIHRLAVINDIKAPFVIHPGQILHLVATR